jgi:2,5-furandicarboxylate decarboxylase 1
MAGVAKLEEIGGELEVAGGLMGEPLEVVEGETVDLPIPARAEVVIEGVIEDPTAEEEEGPFGEWTKYTAEVTAGKRLKPWMIPTALYMRKDPIFHVNIAAHNDHSILGSIPRMGSILRRIRGVVPSVKAVNLPPSGCARSHLYISLKKGVEGEPKRAALIALAASPQIKLVICVDEDINVFNEEEVLWALATRFQADKDMTIMPYFLGAFSNPTAYDYTRTKHGWLETKLICDATKPLPPAEFPPRARAPEEVFKRLTLQKLHVEGVDSEPELMRRLRTPT